MRENFEEYRDIIREDSQKKEAKQGEATMEHDVEINLKSSIEQISLLEKALIKELSSFQSTEKMKSICLMEG